LSKELLEGDEVTVDLNKALRNHMNDSKAYVQDLEMRRSLINDPECKDKFTVKWVKSKYND
jgi:hypothetical protein